MSVIQGHRLKSTLDKEVVEKITLFPGSVPEKLPKKEFWQESAFNFINFSPMSGMTKHEALPHIRMDQVLQFLLADKMI